jgi:hypothetical protein
MKSASNYIRKLIFIKISNSPYDNKIIYIGMVKALFYRIFILFES